VVVVVIIVLVVVTLVLVTAVVVVVVITVVVVVVTVAAAMVYCSPNNIQVIKSRRMRWAGNVALKEDRRGAYRSLVGRPEGKRQLGRQRCRWRENIKMDLQDVGWRNMDWTDLAKGRDRWPTLLVAVMNLWVP
jgi:hypothetical protein